MKHLSPLLLLAVVLAPAPPAAADPGEAPPDWRVDLLREEGLGSTREELAAARKNRTLTIEDLEALHQSLGSENFAEREQAQRDLIRAGGVTLNWLQARDRSPDPEIRRRVAEIREAINTDARGLRAIALQHASQSLWDEGAERRADTGGLFYEGFDEPCPKLAGNYRQFIFENPAQRTGDVTDGQLRFPGDGGLDDDQRLVLKAAAWPGAESFGEAFTVSARLGGDHTMAIAWHLGITVGNIRALYHPGMPGGEFRFEEADTNDPLTRNVAVGFNPSAEQLQTMRLEVQRLPDGRVRLDVVLREGGGKPGRFATSITVKAGQIGPLDRISLDRSGRNGGTARFDELLVRLSPAE